MRFLSDGPSRRTVRPRSHRRRVVVFAENQAGGATAVWLLSVFDWIQRMPHNNLTMASLSCQLNQGVPGDPY
ncbi:MAG: hypothetical protein LBQ06_04975 [Frankiaceae bacterium]|jgi:hypothetical protein|nr:hypothetical protein [Frankiaceae bacterium]